MQTQHGVWTMNGKCPCCGMDTKVKVIPAKWQGGRDRVVVEHKKWQENYR